MRYQKSKESMIDSMNYIASIGNQNILINIIMSLEKDIKSLKEDHEEFISSAPHFFEWLILYCTYFTNDLYHSYHRLTGDKEIYSTDKFSSIIAKIKNYHKENPDFLENDGLKLDKVMMNVYLIVELRHCFQHGGLPNRLRKLKHANDDIIKSLLKPSNFKRTKEIIKLAQKFTSNLPKPTIIGNNLIQIG